MSYATNDADDARWLERRRGTPWIAAGALVAVDVLSTIIFLVGLD